MNPPSTLRCSSNSYWVAQIAGIKFRRLRYDISIDQDKQQIVIDDMNYAQYEMVRKLQGDRPYYEPEFAKFIKFSDPNYIDESVDISKTQKI